MQCEALLLGRAPSDGAIDATSLATLVRNLLVSRSYATRRYLIRCKDTLEFVPHRTRRRRVDDEGFESDNDDDNSSTKSLGSDDTISNSSSCCFVDDHVFKTGTLPANSILRAVAVTSTSSVGTDSANSSGASDTDDLEGHNQESKSPYQKPNADATASKGMFQRSISEDGVETFPISDVVFCHTDPQFPKVAVWVVKKTGSGLETLVFECKNSENLKKICSTFQEVSRRSKLDQFTHTNRRKDVSTSLSKSIAISKGAIVNKLKDNSDSLNSTATLKHAANARQTTGGKDAHVTNGKSSSTNSSSTSSTLTPLSSVLVKSIAPQTLPKQQQEQQTIIRTLKNTTDAITNCSQSSLEITPSFTKTKPSNSINSDILPLRAISKPIRVEEMPAMSKFNLVQRTDGDGVTHIEISRGIKDDIDADGDESNGPSSILSINTPDIGNFHSLTERNSKSRFSKEIESVIRSDIDSAAMGSRKETQRQRQPAILVLPDKTDTSLRKVWTSNEEGERSEDSHVTHPPMRPERRRYIKKKHQAPDPPKGQSENIKLPTADPSKHGKDQLDSLKVKGTQIEGRKSIGNQQKIVKGQFIRVSVDQPQPVIMPVIQQGAWGYTNNGNLVAYSPAPWSMSAPKHSVNRAPRRKSVEDIFQSSQKYHQQYPKTRAYRSKSPPARPMAYRYIDTVPQSTNTLSKRFFGVSQKLKEIGGAVVNSQYATSARRRNSLGELAHAQQNGNAGGNLKSVIKKGNKGRMGEYQEPKKVTFSAYATVQVVD